MEQVLVTTGLTKTYDTDGVPVAALRGVDLTVAEGEFVSIMGPSGCGEAFAALVVVDAALLAAFGDLDA